MNRKLLLIFMLLCGFLQVPAQTFEVEGITYRVLSDKDKTCEVSSCPTEFSGTIEIPDYVSNGKKYSVVGIGKRAFEDCSRLTQMQLPNTDSEIKRIKNFYIRYMEAIEESDREEIDSLIQNFLTPEMQAKMGRLVALTDGDPLIRAQDVSTYGIQSLQCRHLQDDWYMVSYHWSEMDSVGIHIPLKIVKDKEGQSRIGYVTPILEGENYGNHIFDISKVVIEDDKDAYTFIETFFKAYVYPYVKMLPSLDQDLMRLRQTYLTPDMQKKYATMSQMFLEDASPLDPLIGCADFDAFWYSSIMVTPIEGNLFKMEYNTGDGIVCVKLTVMHQNGKYRISDLNLN